VGGGIAMVPRGAADRWTVTVAPGVYRERVWVPADVGPLTLVGDASETTMLVYHCCPAGNGRER
jgi:pectin methylesterase-like acyl-CoA thioesterase